MNEQMSLENLKKQVIQCLMKNYNRTEEGARKSVQNYNDDFPQFLEEKWEPSLIATAIVLGY